LTTLIKNALFGLLELYPKKYPSATLNSNPLPEVFVTVVVDPDFIFEIASAYTQSPSAVI
jgi:hypothetical protein